MMLKILEPILCILSSNIPYIFKSYIKYSNCFGKFLPMKVEKWNSVEYNVSSIPRFYVCSWV